jgi:glycosyltransferase involved in cell wall biosynthesis
MKILMITGIFPPDIGGPATYVPTMARELVERGHRVSVMTLSDRLDHEDRIYNFPVHRIRRMLLKPWRFVVTVLRIVREGRGAEVLYVNGLYVEAVMANYLLRKPMMQKIVGDWAWERSTNKGWVKDSFEEFQKRNYGIKVELLKTLRTFCARRADSMITPSRYLAGAVANWGVAEGKIYTVYNAVEIHAPVHSALPLTTRFKIVTVGRLVALKQIDRLMEALLEIKDAGLVIVGDGPDRNRLEAVARTLKLTDRVYFAGQKSQAETSGLMAACDVFVLNSTHEGFPHVVLEAMCAGLPIVATAVGGTVELVQNAENGVLIAPESNGTLAKTILRLLSSAQERQQLIAGGQATIRRYQQPMMVEVTERALQTLAS